LDFQKTLILALSSIGGINKSKKFENPFMPLHRSPEFVTLFEIQFLFHIFRFLEHDFRFGWRTLRYLALETLAFMARA